MLKIHDCIQGSDDWRELRLGKITPSRVKNIITPTGKLSAVATDYARKLARECFIACPHEAEQQVKISQKHAVAWGNIHEPQARDYYRDSEHLYDTGEGHHKLVEVGFLQRISMPTLGCSPDGIVMTADELLLNGVEIKCPSIDTFIRWAAEGVLPDEHKIQVHSSMVITRMPWDFVAYYPAKKPLSFTLKVDRDKFTERVEKAIYDFEDIYRNQYEIVKKILT